MPLELRSDSQCSESRWWTDSVPKILRPWQEFFGFNQGDLLVKSPGFVSMIGALLPTGSRIWFIGYSARRASVN